MSHTAYPKSLDLERLLVSAGIIASPLSNMQDVMDLQGAVESATEEWENNTGWRPFLSATQTRTYDPPGPMRGPVGVWFGINNMGGSRVLPLYTGILSVTTLKVGVTASSAGTTLTLGTDFWLKPQNATSFNQPYRSIEFAVPQWGNPQSITVTGPFGYSTTVPNDVWTAIIKRGAAILAPELALQISGGLYSERRLNSETRYSGAKQSPLSVEAEEWQRTFNQTVKNYKRRSVS